MWELASAVDAASGSEQVLTLEWKDGADPTLWADFWGEMFISPVAAWAANVLMSYGFVSSSINLIGHSWGGVMSAEISEAMDGDVDRLIALDPAEDAWPPAGTLYDPDDVDFAADSTFSWAFLSSEWGSGESVPRADAAFMVDIDGDGWIEPAAHSHVVHTFTEILNRLATGIAGPASQVFALDHMNPSGSIWINNSFDGNAVTGGHSPSSGQYEGVLYSREVAEVANEALIPVSFEYRNLSGQYGRLWEGFSPHFFTDNCYDSLDTVGELMSATRLRRYKPLTSTRLWL